MAVFFAGTWDFLFSNFERVAEFLVAVNFPRESFGMNSSRKLDCRLFCVFGQFHLPLRRRFILPIYENRPVQFGS